MMTKRLALRGLAALALLQSGCVELELSDAVSAGIYDFVSESITAVLFSLLPAAGM